METDNEQQSLAENNEVVESDVEEQELPQTGESDAPEETETDEQKNARALEEDAERKRVKEEKRQASVQRRFDELTRQRYEEKARADALQAIIDRGYVGNPQQKTQESGEPQRDQFDSYEDFLEARAVYRAEKIVSEKLEKYQATQAESVTRSQAEQSRKDAERQFLERRNALEKEIPDYRDVIEDWEPNLPNSLVDLIVKLPEGPLVSYHMAKNPALEEQFRTQPEYMHGVILGQLVASLKSTPKVSAAPKPGKPVSSSKAGSSSEPPSDPEQYYSWAKKNLR